MEGRQGSAGLQRPVPRTLPYLQQEGSQLSPLNHKTTHQNAVCACRNMLRSNTFLWYVTHCDCDMSHIVTVIWGQWCKVPTSKANAQRGGGGGGEREGKLTCSLGQFSTAPWLVSTAPWLVSTAPWLVSTAPWLVSTAPWLVSTAPWLVVNTGCTTLGHYSTQLSDLNDRWYK